MSFQSVYDWIKGWKAPQWMKDLLQQLNDIMVAILKEAGEQYVNNLKSAVIEAAGHDDWSSEQKFDYVFNQAKKGLVSFSVTLKDSEINALIEYFVNLLKKNGTIA